MVGQIIFHIFEPQGESHKRWAVGHSFEREGVAAMVKNDYLCTVLIPVEHPFLNSVCMLELNFEKWPY